MRWDRKSERTEKYNKRKKGKSKTRKNSYESDTDKRRRRVSRDSNRSCEGSEAD